MPTYLPVCPHAACLPCRAVHALHTHAIFHFFPPGEDSDELSFNVGDVLFITEELEGWYRGTTADKSRSGIFPQNYVEIIE